MSNKSRKGNKIQQRGNAKTGDNTLQESRSPLIIVPLDGSQEAKAALPAARSIAQIVGATIHIVHASEKSLSLPELLQHIGLSREETHEMVVDQAPVPAAEAIVQLATEKGAALIVMTTRGHTAYLGRTVRPVVEQVISKAPCPVLLIRPEIGQRVAEMREIRRILLPLDGAPSSAAVIGPALEIARRTGAEIDVLYVATRAKRPEERGSLAAPRYIDQPQYEWPAWSQEFLRRFSTCLGRYPKPPSARIFLRSGDPATEILSFAAERDVDLIVLEWRGRFDPSHAGTVKGVLQETPCPVLLLRTTPDSVN